MHGSIFTEFRRFVESKSGAPAWQQIASDASLQRDSFDPLKDYPDEELNALIGAATRRFERSSDELLFDFGFFIAPSLLRMFWGAIKPEWRALDVIEHTDDTIHSIVRLETPVARPPYLVARRVSTHEVEVRYDSPRKLCALAKGIATGIGDSYLETITIEELECMHRGGSQCLLMMRDDKKDQ